MVDFSYGFLPLEWDQLDPAERAGNAIATIDDSLRSGISLFLEQSPPGFPDLEDLHLALRKLPLDRFPDPGPNQLHLADVDGDGEPELIADLQTARDPILFADELNGLWTVAPLTVTAADPLTVQSSRLVHVDDFTGDGVPDLLIESTFGADSPDLSTLALIAWRDGEPAIVFECSRSRSDPAAGCQPVRVDGVDGFVVSDTVPTATLDESGDPVATIRTTLYLHDGEAFALDSAEILEPDRLRRTILRHEHDRPSGLGGPPSTLVPELTAANETEFPAAGFDWLALAHIRRGESWLWQGYPGVARLSFEAAQTPGPLGLIAGSYIEAIDAGLDPPAIFDRVAVFIGDGRDLFADGAWLPGLSARDILRAANQSQADRYHSATSRSGQYWVPDTSRAYLPDAVNDLLQQATVSALAARPILDSLFGEQTPVERFGTDLPSFDTFNRLIIGAVSAYFDEHGPVLDGLDRFAAHLDMIPQPSGGENAMDTVFHRRDLDGDGDFEMVLLSAHALRPIHWFNREDGVWVAHELNLSSTYPGFVLPDGTSILHLEDVTADGVSDLVLTTSLQEAQSYLPRKREELFLIFTWRDGAPLLVLAEDISIRALIDDHWSFEIVDGRGVFRSDRSADLPGIPPWQKGPTLRYTRAWDGERFKVSAATLVAEPHANEDFQSAEAAYRNGDFATAAPLYRQILTEPSQTCPGLVAGPRIATFRLAQIAAFQADPATARLLAEALVCDQIPGSDFFQVFLDAYGDGDIVAALIALQHHDNFPSGGAAQGGGFYALDRLDAVLPGHVLPVIAARLDQPDDIVAIVQAAAGAGLKIDSLHYLDINGDGLHEAILDIPPAADPELIQGIRRYWLLGRIDGVWRVVPTGFMPQGSVVCDVTRFKPAGRAAQLCHQSDWWPLGSPPGAIPGANPFELSSADLKLYITFDDTGFHESPLPPAPTPTP